MESDDDSIRYAYCFVAIELNTKLVLNFALGRRSQATTDAFIEGLAARQAPNASRSAPMDSRPTKSAITTTLGDRCDYAQVNKVFTQDPGRSAQV